MPQAFDEVSRKEVAGHTTDQIFRIGVLKSDARLKDGVFMFVWMDIDYKFTLA